MKLFLRYAEPVYLVEFTNDANLEWSFVRSRFFLFLLGALLRRGLAAGPMCALMPNVYRTLGVCVKRVKEGCRALT